MINLRSKSGPVPLGELLKREGVKNESVRDREKCELVYGEWVQSKKGEDFTLIKPDCERVPGDPLSTFSIYAIFDGHNGSRAAIYSKENLLSNILSAIPPNLSRDEWLGALPRALVSGFVRTDKDFQSQGHISGTTVTFVIIDGLVITVGSVGDSRAVLEAEGSLYYLSADHRLEENEEEVERVTASGGDVGRLNVVGSTEIGPLRCWPGGLCLSRSIGDRDVGEFIVPVPHVKQVKLSSTGGRLILCSDGVWDALSSEMAFNFSRALTPEAAANKIVKEAVHVKGLRDDTTCIVVDIIPLEKLTPTIPPPPKKQGMGVFKHMFRIRKTSESSSSLHDVEYHEPDMVEEIYEEGSACLAQRLQTEYPIRNIFKLFICAICQTELKPTEGVSVHSEASRSGCGKLRPWDGCGKLRPWDGPFLCHECQKKREAMEGKRHRRGSSSRNSSSSGD